MNNFCRHLRLSLSQRFNIDVDVYFSKKKKLAHMSLVKPLSSYRFSEEIIEFVKKLLAKKKILFSWLFVHLPKIKPEPKMEV